MVFRDTELCTCDPSILNPSWRGQGSDERGSQADARSGTFTQTPTLVHTSPVQMHKVIGSRVDKRKNGVGGANWLASNREG